MPMTAEQFQAYHNDEKREQLKAAFELIENKEHWKKAIDAWISPAMLTLCEEACVFFTGAVLKTTGEGRIDCYGNTEIRVTSVGYYGGPCN